MKKFYLIILTMFSVNVAAATTDLQKCCHHKQHPQVPIEQVDAHLSSSREAISSLVNDHHAVMKQFDSFAKTLKKTYLSGQGLIENDLHQIIDATLFAAEKHRVQVRKDPEQTPYIVHPIGVARILMKIGKVRDTDMIIGALLHDTVEDTETTFEEIQEKFGLRVVGFVKEVTDDKSLPKEERKQLQIEHAHGKSAGAAQIKLADKTYNTADLLRAPPLDWDKERVDAYFIWAKEVVDHLPWVNSRLKRAFDKVIISHEKQSRKTS